MFILSILELLLGCMPHNKHKVEYISRKPEPSRNTGLSMPSFKVFFFSSKYASFYIICSVFPCSKTTVCMYLSPCLGTHMHPGRNGNLLNLFLFFNNQPWPWICGILPVSSARIIGMSHNTQLFYLIYFE